MDYCHKESEVYDPKQTHQNMRKLSFSCPFPMQCYRFVVASLLSRQLDIYIILYH